MPNSRTTNQEVSAPALTSPSDQSMDGVFSQFHMPGAIGEAALHGAAGEVVRRVEPHTEADLVALLLTLLVMFGNVIGRSAHFVVSGTNHFTNLFLGLVGPTSMGRKGTAQKAIECILELVDPDWARRRIGSGLSSGEGIIAAVRDPVWEVRASRRGDGPPVQEMVMTDAGESDKRLLIIEEEFAGPLKAMERQGSTLSPVMRNAWDSRNISKMTVNPMTATNPHISVIAHISKEELQTHMSTIQSANGFGNRFLWTWVRRSKLLPHGGNLNDSLKQSLADQLREAVMFARTVNEVYRDQSADRLWEEVYPSLTREWPGLYGSMLARAAPQVLRIAMIYALLDRQEVITGTHLEAALAVWRYCDDSVRFIFGNRLGDPDQERILRALREAGHNGLSRSEISDLFHRNRRAVQIEAVLYILVDSGLASYRLIPTEGRTEQRWYANDLQEQRPQTPA